MYALIDTLAVSFSPALGAGPASRRHRPPGRDDRSRTTCTSRSRTRAPLRGRSSWTRAASTSAGTRAPIFFAAGVRAEEMAREVNDRAFDVSLHVYFRDKAAHDAYQEHPRHKQFIAEMSANWKTVRVFDSWVETSR